MHDNLNLYSLENQWECLDVYSTETGSTEALEFLHRLTSADFKKLGFDEWTHGFFLSSKGKIIFFFKAFKMAADHFRLLIAPPRADVVSAADYAHAELENFHFREKIQIEPKKNDVLYVRITGNSAAVAKLLSIFQKWEELKQPEFPFFKGFIEKNFIFFEDFPWKSSASPEAFGLLIERQDWNEWKKTFLQLGFKEQTTLCYFFIQAGLATAPNEINTDLLPLEAGLDFAVHEQKGCYPGQEVIERIHSLGQPPRQLIQLQGGGPAPETLPADLTSESGKACGVVTSAFFDSNLQKWFGLGFIKRAAWDSTQTYQVEGKKVEIQISKGWKN